MAKAEAKLSCLRTCLQAYRRIFTRNPQARYFKTWFFDAFRQTVERTATASTIEAFIHERLESCFEAAAKGLVLWNSRSTPLYLFCCAAANKRGAPVALKIAQAIIDD